MMHADPVQPGECAADELIGVEVTKAVREALAKTSRRSKRVRYHLTTIKVKARSNGSGVVVVTFTQDGSTALHRFHAEIEPQAFRTIREQFSLAQGESQKKKSAVRR